MIPKVITLLLTVIILFGINFKIFAKFGDSCSPLPVSSGDTYLLTNTVYGHLVNSIDMPIVPNACNINTTEFNFCLKNPQGSATECEIINLEMGNSYSLNSLSATSQLGGSTMLQDIVLQVQFFKNNICLTMETSRGVMPIICKGTTPTTILINQEPLCKTIGESCYSGHSKSQSLLNFSGVAVYCLQETLDKVFYIGNSCAPDDKHPTLLAPFSKFQEALKAAVRAALIIYVIFYGFKIVLSSEYVNLDKISLFVIKLILVAYFSVGLGPIYYQNGQPTTKNGMLEYALPFFKSLTSEMAYIVFSSGGAKGLCEFDNTKYQPGFKSFAVWDAVDCRIGYYLGLQLLYNITDMVNNTFVDAKKGSSYGENLELGDPGGGIEALKGVGIPFLAVLFGFFMSCNLIIFISGLLFALFFISIILHFLTSYLVCLITLYVMAYVSPIFIPMALFEKTKSYFDSWLKITISCSLQPAIIACFIALLLTMYDSTFYKNCQFAKHDYSLLGNNFTTFELQLPETNIEECKSSIGYKLLKFYIGQSWDKFSVILFPINIIGDLDNILMDFIYLLMFTYIFYYFSQSFSQFAGDITSGPNMSGIVASPTRIVQMAKNAAKFAKDAAAVAKGAKGGGGDAKQSMNKLSGASRAGGASGAMDKIGK